MEEKVCGHPGLFLDLKGWGEDSGVGREAALLAGGRNSRQHRCVGSREIQVPSPAGFGVLWLPSDTKIEPYQQCTPPAQTLLGPQGTCRPVISERFPRTVSLTPLARGRSENG